MSVLVRICLLAVIYAATDAEYLPVAELDLPDSDMATSKYGFQAEQFSNGCTAFSNDWLCTKTQKVGQLSCNFDDVRRADESDFWTRQLPKCNSGEASAAWTNMPYYSYQFSQDYQNVHQGQAAVVSKCLKTTFPRTLISSVQATATLRTGIYPGTVNGEQFHVTFWCKFGAIPKVAGEADPNRFFLQLALHRQGRNGAVVDGAGLPSRILWGSSAADYYSVQVNEWHQVVLTFTEFEQFSLMFFAHHNHGCDQTKLKLIHLDSVVIEKVMISKRPSTMSKTEASITPIRT